MGFNQTLLVKGGGNSSTFLNVYLNSAFSSAITGFQKIPVDTVAYDTGNIWDAVNKRAIPKQAGYYLCNLRAAIHTSYNSTLTIGLNGSGLIGVGVTSNGTANGGSALIYCNGTTDYIEHWGYFASGISFVTGNFDTYLQIIGPL